MTLLGEIRVLDYLKKTNGEVFGRQMSDAKDRFYSAKYTWVEQDNNGLLIKRNGSSEPVLIPAVISLDEALVAFFGLYSGDGAKGSESKSQPGQLHTAISFSQREPNLVKFAVTQFKRIFPRSRFTFSLGEDSAYFMAGDGLSQLEAHFGGLLPNRKPISEFESKLTDADIRYLKEKRPVQSNVQEDLAFFYQFKDAMREILTEQKEADIAMAGVSIGEDDKVTASLRRPYKKGARIPGGSSRSDETHVGNVTGMGELFLKMLHEIEQTLLDNKKISTHGLVRWFGIPEDFGEEVDVKQFFTENPYGLLAGRRPQVSDSILPGHSQYIEGLWRASKQILLKKNLTVSPLWCYTSGLYLAEGSSHDKMFQMFDSSVSGLSLGFTSSENTGIELILRSLQSLFKKEDCVEIWKVKVGSQYFPELVVVGLKNNVPMLRGGVSGDGKLRTMEISLAIKEWALEVIPATRQYEDKFSHVEPTGAGVPRVDFSASSVLCRWYFPLVMYAVFGKVILNPANEFTHD